MKHNDVQCYIWYTIDGIIFAIGQLQPSLPDVCFSRLCVYGWYQTFSLMAIKLQHKNDKQLTLRLNSENTSDVKWHGPVLATVS